MHVTYPPLQSLSGTAVRMCNDANAKLARNGQKPDLSIACYAEMAKEVNDFVDIMNGKYKRVCPKKYEA